MHYHTNSFTPNYFTNNDPSRVLADEYVYECECGERFRSVYHAAHCRKCDRYLDSESRDGAVVDTRTGAICWSPRVYWDAEVRGADKPAVYHPTLADVWPAHLQ